MWVAQQAAIEATSELERLHVPLDREVDIFSIIEDTGMPLMFRPLKNLSGAYFPAKQANAVPGVLIHSGHFRSRQRYTAAHEYGHHIHDQRLSLDTMTEVVERGQQMALPPRERFAEVFAAWFLMPTQLVSNVTKALGIDSANATPSEIYALSLAFGTSYRATITQLMSLGDISANQANNLRRWQPRQIKERLSWHGQLTNPRNDIWLVDKTYNDRVIHPRVGDELHVLLPENPSTGFIWTDGDADGPAALIDQRFVEDAKAPFGGEGRREFRFTIKEPASASIQLRMRRPWMGDGGVTDSFHLNMVIEEQRLGINPKLLLVGA